MGDGRERSYILIVLLGFGAAVNLLLALIGGRWGIPGPIFLVPLTICLFGMAAVSGVRNRQA